MAVITARWTTPWCDKTPTGRTVARSGLVGQVADLGQYTRVVPFNDLAALHAALAPGDVACVLTELGADQYRHGVLLAEGFGGVRQLTASMAHCW